LPSSQPRR